MIIGREWESEEVAEFKIEVAEFKIDGVYSKICQEEIEKLQSISKDYAKENCRFNYKIMTFDSTDVKGNVAVDDYDVLLIKCEDEKDIQELQKLNLRCIFFSNDEALISFTSCLYISSCNYYSQAHIMCEPYPLDMLSCFVNTKVPLKYDVKYANVINSLENATHLYIMFFKKDYVQLRELAKKTAEIYETYPNIIEFFFEIGLQDFGIDLMAFYI